MKKNCFNVFWKVRHSFTVIVLLLGLFLITVAGCGGSGGNDIDRNEIIEEVTLKMEGWLSDRGQEFFKNELEAASTNELEELNDALEELMEAAADYEARRLQQEQEDGEALSEDMGAKLPKSGEKNIETDLNNIFGNIWDDGRRGFILAGLGYSSEVLGGAGGTVVVVFKVGGTASLNYGVGTGVGYDFLNFKRYEYDLAYCAGSAGIAIGAKIGLTGDVNAIVSQSLLLGFSKDQRYDGGLSLGIGASPGVSIGKLIAGLGLSATASVSRGLDDLCSWTDCIPIYGPVRDMFSGDFTNQYGFSMAVQVSTSLGSAGADGNLSVVQSYTCSSPARRETAYLNDPNPSRLKMILAGVNMAKDIVLESPPSPLVRPASTFALLYGLIYDKNLISETPLPAPTANAATSVTNNSFQANWRISRGATGYRLDVSTNSGFTSPVSGYNNLDVGNNTSRSVSGLSANTQYWYRVRANNAAGTSGDSNKISVTTSAPAVERWTKDASGVVWDRDTNLEWYNAGSDVDHYEAEDLVNGLGVSGGGWRMPTLAELRTLYATQFAYNITPLLDDTGMNVWVWSGELYDYSSSAWNFDFYNGLEYWPNLDSRGNASRAFAVRSR